MTPPFNGLGSIMMLSNARTRSISAENKTGEKGGGARAIEGFGAGPARDHGLGWKVSPAVWIERGETFEMAAIEGPGIIQHIWLTIAEQAVRSLVIRFYWDGEETPSIEAPLGDFFGAGWKKFAQLSSIPVCVNPNMGLNCYWPMPFRKSARITVENVGPRNEALYYQATYALDEVPADAAYLHAQFRRSNPLEYKEDHVMLDGLRGKGHFVGCTMLWQTNNAGWWGEGEIKFYMDGDAESPTICGTGTEDYFGGAYCFSPKPDVYQTYTTPYLGFHYCDPYPAAGLPGQRFGLYRWHILDPIRFEEDLRVTMQALGWRSDDSGGKLGNRYLSLRDDVASTSFWYQREPHAPFPDFPNWDDLEII